MKRCLRALGFFIATAMLWVLPRWSAFPDLSMMVDRALAAISITGTVYSDEGTTPLTGVTVAASLNGGAAAGTDAVDGGGQYTIAGLNTTGGTLMTLYIDGAAGNKAVTVTFGTDTTMTGIHLYQDRLIVRSDSGSVAMTNPKLRSAKANADTDITAIYDVTTTNILKVAANKELWVWTGDGFTPGARVHSHDVEVKGTMAMSTNGLIISGSLVTNAGTFTTSSGIILNSSASNETLSMGTNSVQSLTIDDSALGGYWKFDEGVGTTSKDSSPYKSTVTFNGNAAWALTNKPPRFQFYSNAAFNMDGTGDFGTLTTAGLNSTNRATFTAWIFADTKTAFDGILEARFNVLQGLLINGGGTQLTYTWEGSVDEYSATTGLTINNSQWYFAAAVIEPTKAVVYLGPTSTGALASWTNTKTHNIKAMNGAWRIGSDSVGGRDWDGLMDEVRIYTRALSYSELQSLFQGNQGTNSGKYVLGAALDINGNFRNYTGTLDAGSAYAITISGSWLNVGNFNHQSGTVTFDGVSTQVLSGSTIFYNLTATTSTARTIMFDYTARQNASGALTIRGAAGNLLTVRSSRTGSGARILLDGSSGTQTIDYLDLKDNNAQSGSTLVCYTSIEGCVNSGNNTNWLFVETSVSITGTAYSDEGLTPLASKLIAVSINGAAAAGTDTTDTGGQYSITGLVTATGDVLTLYIDAANEDAVTSTLAKAYSMSGIHLYQDHLIVRSESGSVPLTSTHLNTGNNNGDADIVAIYDVDASNILQVSSNKELWVWTGDTFTPGARVRTHDLEVKGTLTLGTNGLTVSGSLIANAGTFTTNTGIVLGSIGNDETLNLGSNVLQHLAMNTGLVGHWKLDDGIGSPVARDSSGYGNVGTLNSMEVLTDWTSSNLPTRIGFYNANALAFDGTEYVNVTDADSLDLPYFTISAWIKPGLLGGYQNFIHKGTNNVRNYNLQLKTGANNLQAVFTQGVDNYKFAESTTALSVGTWYHVVGTYDGAFIRTFVNGALDGTPSAVTGSPDIGTNNLAFGRPGDYALSDYFTGTLDDIRVYNRALSFSEIQSLYNGNKSTGSGVYQLGSALDLNGNLNVYSGTLDASGSNITIGGHVHIEGDFTKRSGTVTLDGTATQTISGSTIFHNFTKTVSSANTVYLDYSSRLSVSGALTLRGAVSNLLSIRSTMNGSGARILLDGDSGTQTIDYLSVQDSNAQSGATLVCLTSTEGCANAGNNTNWLFIETTVTITGTAYGDEGITPLASKTVAVSINGAVAAGTDATDTGGQYAISGLTVGSGDVLTMYIDGASEDAVTSTLASAYSMTGMHLYQDHLIVRSESGSVPLTVTHLNTANNNGDADITAIYNVDANNVLQVAANKELWVWSGDTFTAGSRVRAHDVEVKGTMAMATSGLTVTGSLIANAGTFTTSTGVVLGGTSNDETLSMGSNSVQNLTMNTGLIGYWKMDDGRGSSIARDSSHNAMNGTLTTMDATNDWNPSTTGRKLFYDPSSIDFDGSDDYIVVTDQPRLEPLQLSMAIWVKVTGDGTNADGNYIISKGKQDSEPYLSYGITYNPGTDKYECKFGITTLQTVATTSTFTSASDWTHIGCSYNGITVRIYANGIQENSSDITGSITYGMATNDDLNIGRWGFPGFLRQFQGYVDEVRFYDRALNASEVKNLYNGSKSTGSGVYQLGSALDVNGNLNWYSGTLDASGSNVTLGGHVLILGDFTKRSGTVTLDGTGTQTISGSTIFQNFTKTVSTANTLYVDFTSRQSASGVLTLRGASSNLLSIRSTKTGSGARILLDGSSGTQTIDYLDVKDSYAQSGSTLVCSTTPEGCVDSGNNINWDFSAADGDNDSFFFFFGF